MTYLDEVVAVCRERLRLESEHQEMRRELIVRRERLLWDAHKVEGVPTALIAVQVEERLRDEGFTPEEIKRLGVSYASIRAAVERPEPPE